MPKFGNDENVLQLVNDKHSVVYTHNEILFSNTINEILKFA